MLRRPYGTTSFSELATTSSLSYADTPPPGTFEYTIRARVLSFTSEDGPIAIGGT